MSIKSLTPIALPADPTNALEAATKQYTDLRVAKVGDAMTGPLTMRGDSSSTAPIIMTSADGLTEHGRIAFYTGGISVRENAGKQFEVMVNGGQKFIVQETLTTLANLMNFQAGAQISGAFDLTLSRDPSSNLQAATKQYVDNKTFTPAAGSVTLAMMANLTQDQFIGRVTASTGVPETATITAAARTVLDDTTTAAMLTTLGAQPVDSDLTTIAALTATTGNMILSAGSAWTSANPATVKTALGLTIGTNVQAWDADLDTLAGLTATTNNVIQSVGSAWASRTPTQLTATLDTFTATLKGLVPPPTTATGKFLKDDATWAVAGGATDVMWVGTSAPSDSTIEVWYDTDEVAGISLDKATGDASYFPIRATISASAPRATPWLLTDENKLLMFSASTAITVTVPLNSSVAYSLGARIDIAQVGAGRSPSPQEPASRSSVHPSLLFRAAGSAASLIKVGHHHTWLLAGDLA